MRSAVKPVTGRPVSVLVTVPLHVAGDGGEAGAGEGVGVGAGAGVVAGTGDGATLGEVPPQPKATINEHRITSLRT